MKKIFTLSCALMMAFMAHAEGFIASVYSNGVLQGEYVLSAKPVLAFAGTDVIVNIGGKQEILFPSLGTTVTFKGDGMTAIENVSREVPLFTISDGSVQVSGLTPGEVVRVYSINGQLTGVTRADGSGSASAAVGKGIVILKTGKTSFKLNNK